jgi:hypothetical protein
MNSNLTTIEVSPEIAEILKAKAMARQLPVDNYLRTLLENDIANGTHSSASLEEFEHNLDELARGTEHLPILPDDFSRADIYADHD